MTMKRKPKKRKTRFIPRPDVPKVPRAVTVQAEGIPALYINTLLMTGTFIGLLMVLVGS